MNKLPAFVLFAAIVGACAPQEPLSEYRPVVDTTRTNSAKFENDLNACRTIALQLEADYKKRQGEQMATNIITGLILGAAVGGIAGNSNTAAYGAAYGAAAGAVAGDYTYDLVTYGPRRVVDRCMTERGHTVLADLGRS